MRTELTVSSVQCTIKTTQLQGNYTTTAIKHEITTTQCKRNALHKFKQTSWYTRFLVYTFTSIIKHFCCS